MGQVFQLLKVGADCEVFLKDLKGIPIPVIGLLGGTKEKPLPVLGEPGFAVQEDCVMPEFNIPPRGDSESFVQSINTMIKYLSKHFREQSLEVDIVASQMFTEDDLNHPQAQTVGCEPDKCVWTGKDNVMDSPEKIRLLSQGLRTGGAHVHVSYWVDGTWPSFQDRVNFVKVQDMCQGIPSVLLDRDMRRKLLYGKAGAYREKNYGHEYRVLSNFWLKESALIQWVFTQTQDCIARLNAGFRVGPALGKKIENIINNDDMTGARALCEEFRISPYG